MFWLIATGFANFLILTTLGVFTTVFRENHDLLVFGVVRALREIPGPNPQKKIDSKNRKKVAIYFSRCGFKKKFKKKSFRQKWSDFFPPWAPGAPYRGRAQ